MIPNAALQAHVSLELHPPSFRLMSHWTRLQPAQFKDMLAEWARYMQRNGVILAPDMVMPWTNTRSHYKWQPRDRLILRER